MTAWSRKTLWRPCTASTVLYLVSNVYEDSRPESILGMQVFSQYLRNLPGTPIFRIETSDGTVGRRTRTASRTHGGFDNDVHTLNDILRSILGGDPVRPCKPWDLYY